MKYIQNKKAILSALSDTDPGVMLEWGPTPRNAAKVASMIGKDMRIVASTLKKYGVRRTCQKGIQKS
jgi:hypothetical protein